MSTSVNISKVFFVSSTVRFNDNQLVLLPPELPFKKRDPAPLPQWQAFPQVPTVQPPTKLVRTHAKKEDRPTCECGNNCPYGDCGW